MNFESESLTDWRV